MTHHSPQNDIFPERDPQQKMLEGSLCFGQDTAHEIKIEFFSNPTRKKNQVKFAKKVELQKRERIAKVVIVIAGQI
jgi:hypothetical protein